MVLTLCLAMELLLFRLPQVQNKCASRYGTGEDRRDAGVSLVARAEVGLGWQILSRLAGPSFFMTLARLQHLVRE